AQSVWPSLVRLHAQTELWKSFIERVKDVRQPAVVLALFGVVSGEGDGWLAELERLKPPRHLDHTIRKLLKTHELLWKTESRKAERVVLWGAPEWPDILAMAEAEARVQPGGSGKVESWIAEFLSVCDAKGNLPKPFLTGEDLKKIGFRSGP